MSGAIERVGEVLTLTRRPVEVHLDESYEEIGIRSFGRGIFHKEPVSGTQLGSKRVFRIEPGDLLLSNVFAWEGAVAVAGQTERGKIGSHRFMTYTPVDDRIDTNWASWFFRSEPGLELIRKASPGSAGRNRTLAIDRFEALEIFLPPPDEQRRVAAHLDQVATSAEAADYMSTHASELSTALAVSLASRPDLDRRAKLANGWTRDMVGNVLTPSRDQVRVDPAATYQNLGIYSFGRGVFAKPDIEGVATSASTLFRVRAGQFIYSRLFAFEGAYAYVPPQFDGYFVSNEFPAFDVDNNRVDVRWLLSYLRSPDRWAELGGSSKGLGVRRQRVPVDAVLAYELWLPPVAEQHRIVAAIDKLNEAEMARASAQQRTRTLVAAAMNEAFPGAG